MHSALALFTVLRILKSYLFAFPGVCQGFFGESSPFVNLEKIGENPPRSSYTGLSIVKILIDRQSVIVLFVLQQ